MDAIASQITNLTIVHSTVCIAADQRKHQSSASLVFVRGIRRWPMNSPHKWPVTRKMFPFYDVIMWWLSLVTYICVTGPRWVDILLYRYWLVTNICYKQKCMYIYDILTCINYACVRFKRHLKCVNFCFVAGRTFKTLTPSFDVHWGPDSNVHVLCEYWATMQFYC